MVVQASVSLPVCTGARERARVLVVDIVGEKVERAMREITDAGGIAEGLAPDVSTEEGAKSIPSRAASLCHRLDVQVNTAASFHHRSIEETTQADSELVLKVNVLGTSFCTKHAVALMKEQKSGSIVNVAPSMAWSPWVQSGQRIAPARPLSSTCQDPWRWASPHLIFGRTAFARE